MVDEDLLLLNLRGLSQKSRAKLKPLLKEQTDLIPDPVNKSALEKLENFSEEA